MDIMDKEKREKKLTIQDIALMGVMVAVIEACKAAMAFLPNIELTSFWIIMFTLLFRWRILFVIPVFILVEGAVYGFGLWWVMYLYAWPLLALAVYMCRERESVWFWSFLSAMFGFSLSMISMNLLSCPERPFPASRVRLSARSLSFLTLSPVSPMFSALMSVS